MTERVDSPSATSGKGRDPGYKEVVPDPERERAVAEMERRDAEIAAASKTAPQGEGESGTLTGQKDSDTGVKADGSDGGDDAGVSFDGGTPEANVNSTPDGASAPTPAEDADETDSAAPKTRKAKR